MALIKEDGSIVANANSYADVADADAYQTDRGRQAWLDADAEVKNAALVRATDYIESRFGLRFIGQPLGDVQELAWPRINASYPATGNAFPTDAVPECVLDATILYAEQTIGTGLTTDGMTELSIVPEVSQSNIKAKKEKVDVLEESTEFFGGGESLRTIQPIPDADRAIRKWLVGGGRGLAGLTVRI